MTTVSSDDESDDDSTYNSEDEVDPDPIPANFCQPNIQNQDPAQPIQLDVIVSDETQQTPRLPLCLMFNARSVYNKVNNL